MKGNRHPLKLYDINVTEPESIYNPDVDFHVLSQDYAH